MYFLKPILKSEIGGGLVLMGSAVVALLWANSPAAPVYFDTLKTYVFGLSILHWINDALMAVFFLLVGLEIKRELVEGELSTPAARRIARRRGARRHGRAGAVFVAINSGIARTSARLGDPGGDRHRLLARRAGPARIACARIPEGISDRARDHRRSWRDRHHRPLLFDRPLSGGRSALRS